VKPWQLISSRVLFAHPWIRFFEDTLRHPEDGRQYSHFYLIGPGEAVAALPLTDEGDVLIIREYRHPVRRVVYGLPGGRLEPDEGPARGAQRELEEETGYRAAELVKLGYYSQFPAFMRMGSHLFLARQLSPTRRRLDHYEEIEVVRLPFAQALARAVGGEFLDMGLTLSLLLAAQVMEGERKCPPL
jgi:ADP-ribose pyrophosphatase